MSLLCYDTQFQKKYSGMQMQRRYHYILSLYVAVFYGNVLTPRPGCENRLEMKELVGLLSAANGWASKDTSSFRLYDFSHQHITELNTVIQFTALHSIHKSGL